MCQHIGMIRHADTTGHGGLLEAASVDKIYNPAMLPLCIRPQKPTKDARSSTAQSHTAHQFSGSAQREVNSTNRETSVLLPCSSGTTSGTTPSSTPPYYSRTHPVLLPVVPPYYNRNICTITGTSVLSPEVPPYYIRSTSKKHLALFTSL